ncbi:MAG: hypothetical protein OEZ01_14395 [Candidatus Heimdallarchaeota archaeon]|nr:hypothetical protein [Candidatus Heimdallarchaeota archaeon]
METVDIESDQMIDLLSDKALVIQEAAFRKAAERYPDDTFSWCSETVRILALNLTVTLYCLENKLDYDFYLDIKNKFCPDD